MFKQESEKNILYDMFRNQSNLTMKLEKNDWNENLNLKHFSYKQQRYTEKR